MWALAILFSVVDAALAIFLLLMSVHGSSRLAVLAPLVFVASVGVTWRAWALLRHGPRPAAWRSFCLAAVCASALAPAAMYGSIKYDEYQSDRRTRRAIVSDMADESVAGPDGLPVGVHLRFHFMTPDGGYHYVVPMMWTNDHNFTFEADLSTMKVDGVLNASPDFEPGRAYTVEFDLKPTSYVHYYGKRPCDFSGRVPEPLRIMIPSTPFGDVGFGGHEERTAGTYNPGEMLRITKSCP